MSKGYVKRENQKRYEGLLAFIPLLVFLCFELPFFIVQAVAIDRCFFCSRRAGVLLFFYSLEENYGMLNIVRPFCWLTRSHSSALQSE